MLADAHLADQIAARPARSAGAAFALQREGEAVENAGRQAEIERALGVHASPAAALGARIGDDDAAAAAAPASLLDAEEPLADQNDAVAVALPALRRLRALFAAAAPAFVADFFARNGDFSCAT